MIKARIDWGWTQFLPGPFSNHLAGAAHSLTPRQGIAGHESCFSETLEEFCQQRGQEDITGRVIDGLYRVRPKRWDVEHIPGLEVRHNTCVLARAKKTGSRSSIIATSFCGR